MVPTSSSFTTATFGSGVERGNQLPLSLSGSFSKGNGAGAEWGDQEL